MSRGKQLKAPQTNNDYSTDMRSLDLSSLNLKNQHSKLNKANISKYTMMENDLFSESLCEFDKKNADYSTIVLNETL